MKNIIILSVQKWNKNIVNNLSKVLPAYNWILIDSKRDFTAANLKKISPLYIFIPHWSYIIPKIIYENYTCIVFHMSDLPYGRGGSPLQNLIIRGHTETKISSLKVVEEIDAGPVYAKRPLGLHGTAEEIFIRANKIIVKMIIDIVKNVTVPVSQKGVPTVFKRRTPEMSSVNEVATLEEMYDYIRMLDAEGYPKAFIENDYFKFEFTRASLKADKTIIADVRITEK